MTSNSTEAMREAFEKWVKSGGSKYTCERYSEHCYAENTVNISWNAWQAARAQQPALSEDEARQKIAEHLRLYVLSSSLGGEQDDALLLTDALPDGKREIQHIASELSALLAAQPTQPDPKDERIKKLEEALRRISVCRQDSGALTTTDLLNGCVALATKALNEQKGGE